MVFKVDQCCKLAAFIGLPSDIPWPPVFLLPALVYDWHLSGAFSSCCLLSGGLTNLARRCPLVPLLNKAYEKQDQIRNALCRLWVEQESFFSNTLWKQYSVIGYAQSEQDLPANGSRCTSDSKSPRQYQTAFLFWIRIASLTILQLDGFLVLM